MISKKDKNADRVQRHARVRKKICGTAETPRFSVYRSLNHIYVQVIDDVKGVTLVSASTMEKAVREKISASAKNMAVSFFKGFLSLLFIVCSFPALSLLPSLDKGTHASNHENLAICGVILNRRTASTPLSSALQMTEFSMVEVEESRRDKFCVLQGT